MSPPIRRVFTQLGSFLRTSWMIFGITLTMFLLVEVCYRIQRGIGDAIRTARAGPVEPSLRDPQESAEWHAAFTREYDATRPQRWKSYLYWGRLPGYHGKYVNIDSAGHRVTPQPQAPADPVARVFFFGGSTVWGTGQRDDHTIPAEAGRRLQTIAGPGQRIEVTNFGESGYIGTQELLSLMLALRAGARPDVVVLYDGINDIGTTVQYGRGGVPQNESKRVAEFTMGRALDRTSFVHGTGHDLHALGVLAGQAVRQIAFVEALRGFRTPPPESYIAADSAAHSLVGAYLGTARLVEALGAQYGFTPVYVWQPAIHDTQKRLTPFEDRLMRGIKRDPFQSRLVEVQKAVPLLLDREMEALAPGRFVDADTLFRGDTAAVFLDRIGHNAETAVPRIVDAFWPQLRGAVVARLKRRPIAPSPVATSSSGH